MAELVLQLDEIDKFLESTNCNKPVKLTTGKKSKALIFS